MGLLDALMPYQPGTTGLGPNRPAVNPLTGWVDANPYGVQAIGNILSSIGSGMVGHGSDMGGMVSGISSALAANQGPLGELMALQRGYDQNKADIRRTQQNQNETIQSLIRSGRQDLVDGIRAGAMTPSQAYGQFIQDSSVDKQRAADLARARGASGLIRDPDLRAAVASGAIGINDALKMESDAAKAAAGGPGDWGSTVMLGRDKNGNAIPLRAAPGGGLSVAAMPDGISFDPGGMAGARTSATVDAKSAAAARQMLPAAEQTVAATLSAIDDVRNNQSGLSDQFGNTFGIPNRVMMSWPGSDRGNLQPAMQQLSGQAFMQARQMLRGGGQITDFEGQKAEMAMARMQSAISNGDEQTYLDALADFEDAVVTGYQKLKAAAQGAYASPDNYGGFSGASGHSGLGDLATMKQRYGLD